MQHQEFVLWLEWATQGRRLFVTLTILAIVFSWIGIEVLPDLVRFGAGVRG